MDAQNPSVDGCRPAPSLRERKKEQARAAMHRAALELTSEHGSTCITVEQIADRAGVSPRTFFNYWHTKEQAILGHDPHRIAHLGTLLRERPGDEAPEDSMIVLSRAYIDTAPNDPELQEMRRAVLKREPALGHLSMDAANDVQWELIQIMHERLLEQSPDLGDDEAWQRAALVVLHAFASIRAAFVTAMRQNVSVAEALESIEAVRAAIIQERA
ncbi:TetR/AcrR family transcriptional regulator [Helcobacillus sp. ACRRO]|uniref:TetR/AcrR family transcriptional regulator n=1 Tax=Helcobacillus sp. ACRRO TaxID=2918202 RepID=UPI001EF6E28E|nr:TetR/AcrR family transcriptional regulator [Helcobacillus sp. ACRRO]MCG7426072.1 TetR/AcrR family transcriptional regulator [Helcobacillus sp. ACRRO]